MPVISMFYGIIISLYFFDNKQHHKPHIHVRYQQREAMLAIPDGEIVEIHQEELMADWDLAVKGEEVFKIDPLK